EHGGVLLGVALAATGLGFGAAFSPLLSVALTHVPARDAADASGLLTTPLQLAIVVGGATFGTLYLPLVRPPSGHPGLPPARLVALTSGHAEAVTLAALTATTLVAAACALPLTRRRPAPRPEPTG